MILMIESTHRGAGSGEETPPRVEQEEEDVEG